MPSAWRPRSRTRSVDLVAFEKDKIKGAIRTDFILSAEIIVISLGTVAGRTFIEPGAYACWWASRLIMTVGVYGLVGGHREARRPGPAPQPARGRGVETAPSAAASSRQRPG
jgi:predicted DNA repair protein MutK